MRESEFIKSMDRALGLLEKLKDSFPKSVTVNEMSRHIHASHNTILRLLATLSDRGYALRLEDKTYTAGPRLVRPAAQWLERFYKNFAPHMKAIAAATGESVTVVELSGRVAVAVAYLHPDSRQMILNEDAINFPLWCTAAGHALLSQLPKPQRMSLLPQMPYPKFTPATISTWQELSHHLEVGLKSGIFRDERGFSESVSCYALPAKVSLPGVFAIAVSFPANKPEKDRAAIRAALAKEARALSAKLSLTPREREIVELISQGKTNKEIAAILGTSVNTVRKQVETILGKFGVSSRAAVASSMGQGVFPPPGGLESPYVK